MNGSEPLSTLTRVRFRPAVVVADPRAELADPGLDRLLGDEDLADVGVQVDGRRSSVGLAGRLRPRPAPRRAGRRRRRRRRRVAAGGDGSAAASAAPSGGGRRPAVVGVRPTDRTARRGAPRRAVRGDLTGRPGQLLGQREPAVLEHQGPEVAGVEQLDPDVRVELAQAAQLAVLLAHELLAQRGQLDVQVEVGQVEVRGEALERRRRRCSTGSGRRAARTPSGRRRSRGSGTAPPRWRGRRRATVAVGGDASGRQSAIRPGSRPTAGRSRGRPGGGRAGGRSRGSIGAQSSRPPRDRSAAQGRAGDADTLARIADTDGEYDAGTTGESRPRASDDETTMATATARPTRPAQRRRRATTSGTATPRTRGRSSAG